MSRKSFNNTRCYTDSSSDNKDDIINVTQYIAFIGPCKAGKTSLIRAIKNEMFCYNYIPTKMNGESKMCVICDGSFEITYHLKDFSGKIEYFNSIPIKLLNCNAIIMVIDLNDYNDTIDQIIEWSQYINNNARNFKRILLVGNKYDLNQSNKDKLKQLSNEYNIQTKHISCKTNKNIDKIIKWLNNNTHNPNGMKQFAFDSVISIYFDHIRSPEMFKYIHILLQFRMMIPKKDAITMMIAK